MELCPVYDLLNSSIILNSAEEIALPIRGKKSKLTRSDLLDYFGKERLGLSDKVIEEEILKFQNAYPLWITLLSESFLSQKLKKKYLELLHERWGRFQFKRII